MSTASGVEAFVQRYRALPRSYYREFAASADLSGFVACGWIKAVRGGQDFLPVIPDACSDILTLDDGAPFVVGPDATTRWVPLREGLVITGLRLRPGAARTILGCAASELLGRSALLVDLWRDARALHYRLEGLEAPGARIEQLEQWVRERLQRSTTRDLGVLNACRVLAQAPERSLDGILRSLGWNARMMHRKFTAACGYGPKHVQRILRVQSVIRKAHSNAQARSLSAIAAELGFADQAHLSKDFKAVTGFSPHAYLAQADAEVGRWLDEPWERAR